MSTETSVVRQILYSTTSMIAHDARVIIVQ